MLATFLLLFLVGEGAVRLSGQRARLIAASTEGSMRRWGALMSARPLREVDDPTRRFALRPGFVGEVDGMTFRVGAHGGRGPDVPETKPANEKRILCIGDSFTFGMWCGEDETLVSRLARAATDRERELGTGIAWTPVNLGVPGYHSGQQFIALRDDGLRLDPDVVVIYFTTNDIQRYGYVYNEDCGLCTDNLPVPYWFKRRAWASHLYGWLARTHYQRYDQRANSYLDPEVPWSNTNPVNQSYTRDALAGMVALCRAKGIPVFVINQPEPMWSLTVRDPDWGYVPTVRWVADVLRELKVPSLDLLGWLRGYADGVERPPNPDGTLPPPDFLLEEYFGDHRVEGLVARAREEAAKAGHSWQDLPVAKRITFLRPLLGEMPETIDFHWNGEGYGSIAGLVYEAMQATEILP